MGKLPLTADGRVAWAGSGRPAAVARVTFSGGASERRALPNNGPRVVRHNGVLFPVAGQPPAPTKLTPEDRALCGGDCQGIWGKYVIK